MRKCPSCAYANHNPAAVACEMCYAKLDKEAEAPKPAAAKPKAKAGGDMEALAAQVDGAPAKVDVLDRRTKKGTEEPEPPIDALLFFLALPVTFPISAFIGLRTRDWVSVPVWAWLLQGLLFLGLAVGAAVSAGPGRPAWLVGLVPVLVVSAMCGAGLLVRIGEGFAGWAALGTLGASSCVTLGAMVLGMGGTVLEHTAAVSAITARKEKESTLVLTGAADGVRLWSLERSEVLRTLEGPGRAVTSVAMGPTLAAAGGDDGAINVWTTKDGAIVRRLEGVKGGVLAVALTEGGETPRLVASGQDGVLKLWEVREGRPLRGPPTHRGAVEALAWSADGKRLASGGTDKLLLVWDSESNRVVTLKGNDQPIQSVAFSPDGSLVASGAIDGKIRVWDLSKDEEKPVPVVCPAIESTRGLVFVDGKRLAAIYDGRSAILWDVVKGLPLGRLELPSQPTSISAAGPERVLIGLGRAVRAVDVGSFRN